MSQLNGKTSNKTSLNDKQKTFLPRPTSKQSSSSIQSTAATSSASSQNQNNTPVLNRSKTYLIKPTSNEENINANKQPQPKVAAKTAPTKTSETNENIKIPSTKPSLSEFKQQKRAEIQSKSKENIHSPKADHAFSNTRSIETIIMKGRQSGTINLNDFGLQESK